MGDGAEFILYAIHSPHGISWTSPRALMLSTLRNQLSFARDKRMLGHVAVELRAGGDHFLTGMTNVRSTDHRKKVFLLGRGLGVLFDTVDGRLEDGDALRPELLRHAQRGRLRYLKVLIRADTAARLRRFLDEYRARGCGARYGGPNRPRHGEGGGCSAFGMSFLALAGVLGTEMDGEWLMRVRVPRSLIGDVPKGNVSLWKIFRSPAGRRWADAHEPHDALDIYDPDRMYDWIERTRGRVSRAQTITLTAPQKFSPAVELDREGDALGLIVDARNAPPPNDAIWLASA